VTGTVTPTGSMATPRQLHSATVLADGTMLVNGRNAEIYDPATGTWHIARIGHSAPR
jgi:hypothetical protein